MVLIAYYIVIMIIFNVVTVFIGFWVERWWGSVVSMIVFLSLYFLTLWGAWVIAVWLTEPKGVAKTSAAGAQATTKDRS